MEDLHCLAIDMGASSVRVMLGNISETEITLNEIYRFKNDIKVTNDSDKWDIESIYNNIKKGITLALKSQANISSIGVDSWGVDYVLLNQQGNLIEMPYAYRDSRTNSMHQLWQNYMSDSETYLRTGINFYPFNTLFQLLSSKNCIELANANCLLFIPNYIYYKLTGIKFNELTIASTSQLVEVSSANFDANILEKLNIDNKLIANILPPAKIIGKITDNSIQKNKIQAVSVCSHDTASAIAAIPAKNSDFLFLSTGTWCILGIESEKPILSVAALKLGITNERGYNNNYRVLKNIIGLWLIQGIQKVIPEKMEFTDMEELASATPQTNHLVNPDDNSFYNPENMIEAFNAYFIKTNQPLPNSIGEYINCAYKSLALEFSFYTNKFETLSGKTFTTIHIIGGGSQSVNFCQNTANYTHKIVESGPVECATLGNIMIQGIAMNKIKDLEHGRHLIAASFLQKTYKPLIEKNKTEQIFKKFLQLKNL